jgi:hypothetical protein
MSTYIISRNIDKLIHTYTIVKIPYKSVLKDLLYWTRDLRDTLDFKYVHKSWTYKPEEIYRGHLSKKWRCSILWNVVFDE